MSCPQPKQLPEESNHGKEEDRHASVLEDDKSLESIPNPFTFPNSNPAFNIRNKQFVIIFQNPFLFLCQPVSPIHT